MRAIATVGGLTMLSRVAGFLRDVLMARILGAGPAADAFFVAFRLPNLFRSLFAEGAFTASFLPMFSGELKTQGHASAKRLAEEALAVMLGLLLPFTALMSIAMPAVVWLLASGFADDPGQFGLAVDLSRITFPYLTLISLVALFGAVLNSLGRFGPFAAAPVLLNLVQIAGLLACGPLGIAPELMLSWGAPVAGAAQLIWMAMACRRAGMSLRLRRPRLTPRVRRLFALLAPGLVGAGVYQINLLIGTNLASWLPAGAVSFLQYADRLNQLPLGVVGVAIGTALLPILSAQVAAGDREKVRHYLSRALEFALFLGLPAAVALVAIPATLVRVLFEGGAFGPAETAATAATLRAFAIGMPALILAKVLSGAYFARQDTKGPVRIAVVVLVSNALLSLALMAPLAHVGLALAPGLTAWLNVGLLVAGLRRRGQLDLDARFKARSWRIVLASLGMGAALAAAVAWGEPLLHGPTLQEFLALAVVVGGGMAVYFGLCFLLGAARLSDLRDLRRRSS
ncbi:MAG TPA: murein biosynthesis integral membrane protein MurJ [Azospirillaceae bacterium]|nr:murein biosynthesis integral membrane protein MurJ [Azospirillaceae bacterium]